MKVIGRGDVTGVVRGESELEDGRRLVNVSIDGVIDGSEPENNDEFFIHINLPSTSKHTP